MAHKIDFKTFDGSYGVYTTPKQCKSLSNKLIKLGFNDFHIYGNESIWILPYLKHFICYSININDGLSCEVFLTPKQLHYYLNKLLKEGSDNQPK